MSMQTGNHLEPGEGWGDAGVSSEQWARLQSLLELVRREHRRTELSPERRARIREQVIARFERAERRRRRWHAFFAGAGVVLAAGLVLTLALRARAD
jgi:hypothetical protein